MKNKLKKLLLIISCICLMCFTACVDSSESLSGTGSTEPYEIVGTPQMQVEYTEFLGYTANITGVLKNTSSRNWSYCQVEFVIYDSNNYNLGTALANINNLRSGDSWKFKATLLNFPETKPHKWVLSDISYF